MYQKSGNTWRKWIRASHRERVGSQPIFKYECNAILIPSQSCPASIHRVSQNRVQLTGYSRSQEVHINNSNIGPPSAPSQNVEEGTQFWAHMLHDMQTGQLKAVTDGSYFPESKTGSAAWIIESHNSCYCRYGRVLTLGHNDVQSAFRSELTGIVAVMTEINYISKHNNISSPIKILTMYTTYPARQQYDLLFLLDQETSGFNACTSRPL